MKRFQVILAGAGVFLGVFIVIFRFAFPFESRFVTNRFELMGSGVKSFEAGGYKGLVRDHCETSSSEGCTCVALIHGLGDDEYTWSHLLTASEKSWAKPVKLFAFRMSRNRRFRAGENHIDYEASVQAEALEKALMPLCPSWILVGNSLGGWETAWVALHGRLKIEKLILVDSAGLRSVSENRAVELFSHPTPENVHEFFSLLYDHPPKLSPVGWWVTYRILSRANLGEVIASQTEADLLDGRLTGLKTATWLFWGKGDGLIPVKIGHEMRSQIPSAVWREIPQCGHLPQQECPQALIQTLNDSMR
jgi:pimeloyl-ACP methyl ester carboxylesterase